MMHLVFNLYPDHLAQVSYVAALSDNIVRLERAVSIERESRSLESAAATTQLVSLKEEVCNIYLFIWCLNLSHIMTRHF